MNVLSTLKSAQLSSGDGQLNLQPILEAQKNIATANQSLQQQVQKYQQLPKAHKLPPSNWQSLAKTE